MLQRAQLAGEYPVVLGFCFNSDALQPISKCQVRRDTVFSGRSRIFDLAYHVRCGHLVLRFRHGPPILCSWSQPGMPGFNPSLIDYDFGSVLLIRSMYYIQNVLMNEP